MASDRYTTGYLKHAYGMSVNPVPDTESWDIPDAIRNRIVLPWKKKKLPGRPKKLRIPSAGEKRKSQSCSKCGKKDTINPLVRNHHLAQANQPKKPDHVAFVRKKVTID